MPLAHPPGEAQFDFGFADAVIGGVLQKVAYAAISLPYSNVRYVQAFPKECIETLQESLVRFFRFLDGVPRKITFDNSKVNTKKILLPFEQWTEVLGTARLTGAVLDRLTHRCHILEASGESYRLRSARKKIGQNREK